MTPITCTRIATVNLRACLKQAFVEDIVLPNPGPNFGAIKWNGSGQPTHYGSYLDADTSINDPANQSYFSSITLTDGPVGGGFYTGTKLMMPSDDGTDYFVNYVDHLISDADDLTPPALTAVNIGNGALSIASVDTNYEVAGVSLEGGDQVSWFEGRTTEVHFLTATTAALTRMQAYELTGGETFHNTTLHATHWLSDGTDIWLLHTGNNSAPRAVRLFRFTPTAVGDPFDYEKFEITFDDADLNTAAALSPGIAVLSTTDDTFLTIVFDPDAWANVRYLEITKDGTGYTEYVVTGNAAVTAFGEQHVPYLIKTAGGSPRLIGYSYDRYGIGEPYPTGTYDLTCLGRQGHVHAKKRTLGPPIITTGNLIPSGDMNAGSDVFKASGDMGPGNMLWKETK